MTKKIIASLMAFALLFSGCGEKEKPLPVSMPESTIESSAPPENKDKTIEITYVESLAHAKALELGMDNMSQLEAIKTSYEYLITNIYFADPVGLDLWRYNSTEDKAISYIENRSLSPLLFNIGSCEDFAAVQVMLLNAVNIPTKYVAGYTLSVDQVFIDHAWAVVNLDDNWYHLDPQLEQNVSKSGNLSYRFFLKSDEDFLIDHRWGQNLIDSFEDITPSEIEIIKSHYMVPACESTYDIQPIIQISLPTTPNMNIIEEKIYKMKEGKGALPEIFLNVEPPILVEKRHITPPLLPNQPASEQPVSVKQ